MDDIVEAHGARRLAVGRLLSGSSRPERVVAYAEQIPLLGLRLA
jgi:hypothetical protein